MFSSEFRQEPPPSGAEYLVVALGGIVLVLGTVVYGGAWLAAQLSSGRVDGDMSSWLVAAGRLVADPDDPAAAWGDRAEGLPGPGLYWTCTALAVVLLAAMAVGVWWVWRRWWSPARQRFGVRADARVARRRDVRALVVDSTMPPVGRMLLGRMAPRGPLLATEDRERHPLKGRLRRQQGDRGSVALIGPTRSGKTVLASAGIVAWRGPVVAMSVKRDLYDTTAAARAQRGELAVFDPGGVTGLQTARWTPLRDVTTASGALRASRALAAAIPRSGVQGGDYWAQHGETFIGAYLCVAGLSRLLPPPGEDTAPREPLTIERLATWCYMHVGITEPLVNELIRMGLKKGQPLEVTLLARHAMTKLMAFRGEDPRIRGSIYATARLAFESWCEPAVAHSASDDPRSAYNSDQAWDCQPRFVDLHWLMAGDDDHANTLYLAAPDTEFARLAPVLGGLLGDLREQIHAWDIEGRRLPKPLLIVIDEAGQLELQWLPAEVSMIAGLGATIVTCWQSKAQITHRYGTLADAVLGGHRSKVIFNGTDDPSTLDYLGRVSGTEHVAQRGWSAEAGAGGRRTVSEHLQREDLLPAHVIRQMRRQEAVLLHGTLPPIHLRTVLWWEDPKLRQLVPTDDTGRPTPPDDLPTCPLTDTAPPASGPVLDPTTLDVTNTDMPQPRRTTRQPGSSGDDSTPTERERPDENSTNGSAAPSRSRPRTTKPPTRTPSQDAPKPTRRKKRSKRPTADQNELPFDAPAGQIPANRVAGLCDRCRTWVHVGEGEAIQLGSRQIIRCTPRCPGSRGQLNLPGGGQKLPRDGPHGG